MKIWEVKVTINGATPPKGRAVTALTYIIRADSPVNAKLEALNRARCEQAAHPRKYKNATFSCKPDCCKEF